MLLLRRIVRFISDLLGLGARQQPHHITRYTMYREIASDFPATGGRILAISHSTELANVAGITGEIVEANFPEYDITDLAEFPDGSFDCVISDQVLEHVRDPFAALRETVRVLRPGGVFLHTTCFINPVHGRPNDFWHFTPEGLTVLCQSAGGTVLKAAGWGNPGVWLAAALGLRYAHVPERGWHPLNQLARWNHPEWAVSTWVIGHVDEITPTSDAASVT